ncbi:C40 family peptidase [Acinetobacter brisouii]|uniref:C40 family peptidase n=1 Tax=Acinetobacter brisouii TaxID=396323 RepID=UPI00208E7DDE|nr:C40 family peptidase [Acinetobacter brisouii]
MEINASQDVIAFIKESAKLRYPQEACGFLVKKGKKTIAVEVSNESPNPRQQFLINPEKFAEVEEFIGEIVAVWHSHVDEPAIPSSADLAGCEESAMPWFLIAIYKHQDDVFEFSNLISFEPIGHQSPLIGRPYVYGIFDCWSLVVDYMKQKHGIEMSNSYPRYENFWKNGKPFFSMHYADEGLVKVTDNTYQDGDVFMFQTDSSGEINHVGVYIGNDKFIHHVQGRVSQTDIYGGYWLKHTILHLRHKDKC